MKLDKTKLAFCIAIVAALFVGRCTAPKSEILDNNHTIDSLQRRIAQSWQMQQIYKQNAAKAAKKAQEAQNRKPVIKIQYLKDTARNHAYKPSKKDSLIKEIFHIDKLLNIDTNLFKLRGAKPSITLTSGFADGVLDMNSENIMLKSNAIQDSLTIAAKDEGIEELGYALNEMTASGEAKNEIVIQERETNKKLTRKLKWAKFGRKVFMWTSIGLGAKVATDEAIKLLKK